MAIGHSVKRVETELSPEKGIRLFCRIWEPVNVFDEQSASIKTLFLVHGACEYGGRYEHFVNRAVQRGWRVIAPDLRGHGHSTGQAVHVSHFDLYLKDLRFLMQSFDCKAKHTILLGCSLGGLISIRYMQWQTRIQNDPLCSSLVLLSPYLGLKLPVPSWKILAGKILSRFRPETRFRSTIDPNDLTHDAESIRVRKSDPLIRKHVTPRWFLESDQAIRNAFTDIEYYSQPTLILQSGEDRIVDPLATKAWANLVNRKHQSSPINLQMLPGWYHEVLREIYWDEAADCLLKFAEQRLPQEQLC